MCRKPKLIQEFWTSANEKADFQIQPGNFGLVPEGDYQYTNSCNITC